MDSRLVGIGGGLRLKRGTAWWRWKRGHYGQRCNHQGSVVGFPSSEHHAYTAGCVGSIVFQDLGRAWCHYIHGSFTADIKVGLDKRDIHQQKNSRFIVEECRV